MQTLAPQAGILMTGPETAAVHVVLAHGAGAAMTSPFLEALAQALADQRIACSRFEFAYMAGRRNGGANRPPPPAGQLMEEYRGLLGTIQLRPGQRLFIGGKSMGGRIASLVAGELHAAGAIAGLVCVGYPFHPPGKPANLRVAHLAALACPTLIVQGTRDRLGSRDEIDGYRLDPRISFAWLADGDHDLAPRRSSGLTQQQHISAAAAAIARFVTAP